MSTYFVTKCEEFVKTISSEISCTVSPLEITIYTGFKRCMARVKDKYDINKRCTHKAKHIDLCSKHNRNTPLGRIDEYPDEHNILRTYRKFNHNVDETITLNHPPILPSSILVKFKIEFNPNINITLYNNLPMSSSLQNSPTRNLDPNFTPTSTRYNSKTKLNIKINVENKIRSLNDIDLTTLDTIRLLDLDHRPVDLYLVPSGDSEYVLYNVFKKKIGFLRDWVDDDNIIPKYFKNSDNKVIHPYTNFPVLQVEITDTGSIYGNINQGIYHEYDYDDDLDVLQKSNQIYFN